MATDFNDTPDMSEPGTSDKHQWMTTVTNPGRAATGHDAGVTGWKLHAIECQSDAEAQGKRSLCGLLPRHGWGCDLFVDDECQKCVAAMDRLEKKQSAAAAAA